MDNLFLGYAQEQEEREEVIRKMMQAYRDGTACRFSTVNYFSARDIEEMKKEAMQRVDREGF